MAVPRRYLQYPPNVHPAPSEYSQYNPGVPQPYRYNYWLPLAVHSPAIEYTESPAAGIELRGIGQTLLGAGIGIAIPAIISLLVSRQHRKGSTR